MDQLSAPDPYRRPPSEPGWYLRLAEGTLRLWDGIRWTDQTRNPIALPDDSAAHWVPDPGGSWRFMQGRYLTDATWPGGTPPTAPATAPAHAEPVRLGLDRQYELALEAFEEDARFRTLLGQAAASSYGYDPAPATRIAATPLPAPFAAPLSTAGVSQTTSPAVLPAPPRGGPWPAIRATLIVGLLLASLGGCIAFLARNSDDPTDVEAFTMCQLFVEDVLKSPSSADFESVVDASITEYADDTFTVVSYVDAENSFGVSLRENFTCEVKYDGDDSWSLVSLTGIE